MKRSTRYPQPFVRELGAYAIRLDCEPPLLGVSSELNRLLTAAMRVTGASGSHSAKNRPPGVSSGHDPDGKLNSFLVSPAG